MPQSLYDRLFKYRERLARSPLEDFLTEALADLLDRLPRAKLDDFVQNLLLSDSAAKVAWGALLNGKADLRWTTQLYLDSGRRPDIVLLVDGAPKLVIEVKVGAALQSHQLKPTEREGAGDSGTEAEALQVQNQLSTYGKWLHGKIPRGNSWLGALIFLTHRTDSPNDFHSSHKYGVPWRSVCRWRAVWAWFTKQRSLEPDTEAWVMLAGQFADFLESHYMAGASISQDDIVAAGKFSSRADRFDALFEQLCIQVKSFFQDGQIHRPVPLVYSEGVIWGWAYLRQPKLAPLKSGWYIGWGIRFPEASSWWENLRPPAPKVPHVFLFIEGEITPLPLLPKGKVPTGWSEEPADNELVYCRPLDDFLGATDLTAAISKWLHEGLKAIAPALPELRTLADRP